MNELGIKILAVMVFSVIISVFFGSLIHFVLLENNWIRVF